MKAFGCWTLTLLGPSAHDSWPWQLASQQGHQLVEHELAWTMIHGLQSSQNC